MVFMIRWKRSFSRCFFACFALLLFATEISAATVWLDDLGVGATAQAWGEPGKNKSVDGHNLTIGGQKFERGLGTHADSILYVILNNAAQSFSASVGVDGEISSPAASIEFSVFGDGKTLWQSGVMKAGDPAKHFTVNLAGVKILLLKVGDAGDGISYDHADWADAKFETTPDANLVAMSAPPEPAIILTPAAPRTPRINGAEVFGVRPGSPFLFTIPATGDRPMTFAVDNLPEGLKLDADTGIISGRLDKKGEYVVTLRAKNALGKAKRKFRIIVGDKIALTPPMGWNSWNCFAHAVSAENVKAAADAMVKSGLINHGWTYINIDDFWQNHRDSKDPTLHGPFRDAQGNVVPNARFPDVKGLADSIHNLGLKAGLYSSPGPWTCGGCTGSWQHERQDAAQYAAWGFDYLKYDLCSYHDVVPACESSLPAAQKPYREMSEFLKQQPRDIVFSLCQYGQLDVWKWGASVGGNSWRTTGDIVDTWSSLSGIGFRQDAAAPFAEPGHWNDPDMLIVGKVGWGNLHPTRLTPNEQYTHISLWCLLSAPLLIGCDMTQLDPFTLNLLENDEVLAVNQDASGKQAVVVAKDSDTRVYAKDMADGSKAIGLFNLGETETVVRINWSDLGLKGKLRVRDLWRQKDLGKFKSAFSSTVPRHGVVLIRVQ
jgi:alpha-galactosidase